MATHCREPCECKQGPYLHPWLPCPDSTSSTDGDIALDVQELTQGPPSLQVKQEAVRPSKEVFFPPVTQG